MQYKLPIAGKGEGINWEINSGATPIGDGAFSSPGAFGFYPWIDADKSL